MIILMLGVSVHAQETGSLSKREQRKLLREEMKQQAAEEAERTAELVDRMVKSATFVLEADMLYDHYGNSRIVQYTINFISADSTRGVLQVGSDIGLGRNGLGGVTVDGSISSYAYSLNKKRQTYTISYVLQSPVGSYDINITVQSSGRADARVNGNFSGGSLRYSGRFVHPAVSRVFKGSSL